jgi:phospholipase/carboxylesterase
MHTLNYLTGGKPAGTAGKALIMLHGRGGSAEDILSLADALPVKDFALFAPQAAAHSWYPYSFLAPPQQNEPWLSSALNILTSLLKEIENKGFAKKDIYFTGFSQGACLMLEFLARNAARYGGAAAFTGGLIGDRIYAQHYKGNFENMSIFIGTSDPDPHVPVQRVHDTTALLKTLHADVTENIYPNMGHIITAQELKAAERVFSVSYTNHS